MSRLDEAVALLRRVSQDYHEALNQPGHMEERFEFCEDCDPKLRAFLAAHDAAPETDAVGAPSHDGGHLAVVRLPDGEVHSEFELGCAVCDWPLEIVGAQQPTEQGR